MTPLLAAASNDMPVWAVVLIPVAFFVVFPLFWCAIMALLSVLGGWSRLANRFPAGGRKPFGKEHDGVAGRIGWVNYNHVLTVHTNEEGFFLQVWVIFRVGHPPLFIPWSEVAEWKLKKFFFLETVQCLIGRPRVATISLPAAILRQPLEESQTKPSA